MKRSANTAIKILVFMVLLPFTISVILHEIAHIVCEVLFTRSKTLVIDGNHEADEIKAILNNPVRKFALSKHVTLFLSEGWYMPFGGTTLGQQERNLTKIQFRIVSVAAPLLNLLIFLALLPYLDMHNFTLLNIIRNGMIAVNFILCFCNLIPIIYKENPTDGYCFLYPEKAKALLKNHYKIIDELLS